MAERNTGWFEGTYWLTATTGFSAGFSRRNVLPDSIGTDSVPTAVTIDSTDMEKVRALLRSRFPDLRSFRQAARGGSLALLTVSEPYVDELRRGLEPVPW